MQKFRSFYWLIYKCILFCQLSKNFKISSELCTICQNNVDRTFCRKVLTYRFNNNPARWTIFTSLIVITQATTTERVTAWSHLHWFMHQFQTNCTFELLSQLILHEFLVDRKGKADVFNFCDFLHH